MKHMAWGAAKRLFQMAPPVAMARQIARSFDIAEMAVKQAANGDWDLAGNTILEIPQDAAESAARILFSPIYAVMAVPAAVRTVMDPQADPEKRGEAAVEALEGIAVAVTAVVGAAAAAKGAASGGKAGPKVGETGGEGAGRGFSSKTKAQARAESNNTCVFCGKGTTTKAGPLKSEIDHAVPKSRGGNHSLDNAQNTCRTCNRQKSAQTSEDFAEKR